MMAEIVDPSDVHSDTGIDVDDLALLPQQAPLMVLLRRRDVMAHLNAWGAGSVLGADAQGRIMTSSALAVVTQEGAPRRTMYAAARQCRSCGFAPR